MCQDDPSPADRSGDELMASLTGELSCTGDIGLTGDRGLMMEWDGAGV